MKRSKQNYYRKHFESNLTNIKNSRKDTKSIISMHSSSITPILLTFQNETLDNDCKKKTTANIFNNYFRTISKKAQAETKYSHTSQTKTLILFSSHQQRKKKLN